ncbi:MAG: hypothetical protein DBX61_10820 [Clostridiales bacterium]|nr:MAG: hypothetical protein DBX61_10820 [Clostridiales bacterium]
MSYLKNIVIIVIIFLLLLLGIKQQLDINELNGNISELEEQLENIKYENEKKQNEIDAPLDEQIEEYAKENGYRDPDAQYFYNDFSG